MRLRREARDVLEELLDVLGHRKVVILSRVVRWVGTRHLVLLVLLVLLVHLVLVPLVLLVLLLATIPENAIPIRWLLRGVVTLFSHLMCWRKMSAPGIECIIISTIDNEIYVAVKD